MLIWCQGITHELARSVWPVRSSYDVRTSHKSLRGQYGLLDAHVAACHIVNNFNILVMIWRHHRISWEVYRSDRWTWVKQCFDIMRLREFYEIFFKSNAAIISTKICVMVLLIRRHHRMMWEVRSCPDVSERSRHHTWAYKVSMACQTLMWWPVYCQ